jgi:predicted HAD superfamily Cof-like phosphohydrolase
MTPHYDNLTDDELIREADGQSGLIKALSERLEMRQRPHVTAFEEQAFFMRACGQTTRGYNHEQAMMYSELIEEERKEMMDARLANDAVEEFDAVLDQIVVLMGYGLSRGWPMNEGWAEVVRSNMAKIDPRTGVVLRRADGKILKPEGWTAPDLASLLNPKQGELF